MNQVSGRLARAVLLLGALALLGISVVAAETRHFDLEIRDRRVVLDGEVVRVNKGDQVIMRWIADERVELHLHGYDIEFELVPGEPVEQAFEAHATGRFPVTSHGFGDEHGGHHTLLYLEVYPG